MTVVASNPLLGAREPTFRLRPPRVASRAMECADLYALTGQALDPWQLDLLDDALGVDEFGRWSAFDVGWVISRQNGKGGGLEARMLAGLYLWDERLQVYTAHQFKTSQEMHLRVSELITNTDVLRKRVRRILNANGEEGVELLNGQRLRFLARSGGSGRGFTGVTTYLDEGMLIDPGVVGALTPTMSAMPNPQLYTAGSAGPVVGKDPALSRELGKLRRRALAGEPGIAFAAWEATLCGRRCPADCAAHDRREDPQTWAATNPALGIVRVNGSGLTLAAIEREWRKYGGTVEFDRERLGVGDYPDDEADEWLVIGRAAWEARASAEGRPEGTVAFGLDAEWPDAEAAAIGVAGGLAGEMAVQVVDYRPGTSWVAARCEQLDEEWDSVGFFVDPSGPAKVLIPDLRAAGVTVVEMSVRDVAAGYAYVHAGVLGDAPDLRHYGQVTLDRAVSAAQRRPLGDGWAWARRGSVGIAPLTAVTAAAFGYRTFAEDSAQPGVWSG